MYLYIILYYYLCTMKLNEILAAKGLTKRAFAELVGTLPQNINSAMKNPTEATLTKWAAALGVPVWQLMATPEEVRRDLGTTCDDFAALVHCGGVSYTPHNLDELARLVGELKERRGKE